MLRNPYWMFFLALLVNLPIVSLGQTGPMGIGNKDGTPTAAGPQPKLLLWLDGSTARGVNNNGEAIYDNNISVDMWLDKSGNNHHFTKPQGQTYNPTLFTSGSAALHGPKGTFDGAVPTPVVRFRNQDDKLVCNNFQFSGSGYSIFFVVRNNGNNKYGLFNYATQAHENAMLVYNDQGIRHVMADTHDRASQMGELNIMPSGSVYLNKSPEIWNYGGIAWSNSSNNSNRDWEFERKDVYETSNNYSNLFPSGLSISNIGTATIGDFINLPGTPDTTSSFNLDIAEIIIFEGKVTRPVSRLLRTYFWIKYAINAEVQGSQWDYFHGNMAASAGSAWGGKFYAPVGIASDPRSNNPGALHEARSEGLILRVKEGSYLTGTTVTALIAAPHGNWLSGLDANVVTNEGLSASPGGVKSRWSRLWEICGRSTSDDDQLYDIGFDFGEGINGGQIPQNVENFELIYRTNPTSGSFSVLPVEEKFITDDEVVFRVRKAHLKTHNRYYTIGTKDEIASSLTGDIKRTWRAYKNGDWNNPLTWTLDGSSVPAYVNPNGATPKVSDNVYIGAGKKVTVTTDISADEIGIMDQLHVIGTLELTATATKPTFLYISGPGLIRCAADNFPIGDASGFANPSTGGTLEFFGSGGFTISTDVTVNNLLVNLSGNVDTTVTLAADLSHYGLFEVRRGSFIVNNNSNNVRTLNSYGNVFVANANSRIRIQTQGNFGTSHNWYFHGDLRNTNGQIKFTGRAAPSDSTQAYTYYTTAETNMQNVIAHFVSASKNQELIANGLSYFSRIVTDKGTDMTYNLKISSNNANKFKLLGRCDQYMYPARSYSDFAQSTESSGASRYGNGNSLALINGTTEIGPNIFIPLLVNSTASSNKWYMLNHTAQLWVNGGDVVVGSLGKSATDNKYGALIIYGAIKVSAGSLSSWCNNGILLRENGMLQIDGGTVYTNQLRTSYMGSSNIGGLVINGGTFHIDPSHWVTNVPEYASLSLKEHSNAFRMTGGTIYITAPTSAGVIFINTDPQNTNITGGTIHLNTINNSANYKIISRAPFWNLTLSSNGVANTNSFQVSGGQSGKNEDTLRVLTIQDLVILNKLLIKGGTNGPKLNLTGDGTSTDASSHLYLYGDLEIESGGSLITNENTVYLVGSSNSSLNFKGSTPYPFYNVVVNKNMDSRNVNIQNSGPNPAMTILGNLQLEKGVFINRGRHVDLMGNLIIRTQFGDETGNGELRMAGTNGKQEIESYSGIIQNLTINNSDGVELLNSGLTINNFLKLTSGSFFIGDNKLRLASTNATPINSFNSTNKFIVCSGNASAGGLEILNHSATQTLNFPIGVNTSEGLKYTNAQIKINSGWEDDGFIRITPVDTVLNTSNLNGSEDYLAYYWKLTTSGYDIRPKVSHRFFYHESDVRGTEAALVAGRVLNSMPFTRSYDDSPTNSHVNTSSNRIDYNGPDVAQSMDGNGTPLVDADYSAGAADRFPIGTSPEIFFSKSTAVGAAWKDPLNWNKKSECTGCTTPHSNHSSSQPSTSGFPGAGDIAVIGFDATNSYRPHVYKAPTEGIEAAQIVFTPLQDAGGNRLSRYYGNNPGDIGILRPTLQIFKTNDIINVGQIAGEGALMLIPAMNEDIDLGVTDIGNFLAEDSSVVVFKLGDLSVRNLNFLPGEVPNFFIAHGIATLHTDMVVRGNLEIAGSGRLYLSDTRNGNIKVLGNVILDKYQATTTNTWLLYNKSGIPKTVEIYGDLRIRGSQSYVGVNPSVLPSFDEPWTPEQINPLLWFDATKDVTIDGDGRVSSWKSQGIGNYSVSQSVEEKQPLYNPGINGMNTVQFDGEDDFLSIPHQTIFNIPDNQNFEIFSVSQTSNVYGSEARPVIIGKGAATNGYLLYVSVKSGAANTEANPNHQYRLYMGGGNVAVAVNNQGTDASLGWARRQGNTGHIFNTIGGAAMLGNVGTRKCTNSIPLTIGAANNGIERFMKGQIGEIIFIKRALTQEERQKMEGYLAHKWGMQNDLSVGHPYRNKIPMVNDDPNATARLIIHGNIIQNISTPGENNNGLKLYHETDSTFVELILTGDGHKQYDLQSGPKARLWKVTMDKGIDYTNSSFSFNGHVDIIGPANDFIKPITLRNGLLKFNSPNIDITLSSGGGDFIIPATGGLEVNAGNLKIKGSQTGLVHSGLLKITGGSFILGDEPESDNYIEYAGAPKIEISDGNLIVGSQIRRNLSNTSGALDYKQTGGNVIVGKYSAPASTRAVFEITDAGSRFEHTAGTLTFVQGINTGARPSLLLTPATPANSNTGGTAEIIIANADSPDGAHIQNFGIQTNMPLNSLTINSNNGPGVHLITNNLELKKDLTIHQGASLDGAGRDLTIHGDLLNNGLFNFEASKVNINHTQSGTVSGSGIFKLKDLNRTGSFGITTVETNLTIEGNFINDSGEMNFGDHSITALKDVESGGKLTFNSGVGLMLAGTSQQQLRAGTSGQNEIDILTIANSHASGVAIPEGFAVFKINKNLRHSRGKFALNGNTLEMAEGAFFSPISPYGESNMIITGNAAVNTGVLLHFPAYYNEEIFVPLGIDRFMPVNLDFSQENYSSGSNPSSYRLQMSVPDNTIADDPNNVLGMYFSVVGTNIGDDLNMDMNFYYNDQYVRTTNGNTEADYIGARSLDSDVWKFPDVIDTDANIITFHHEGDYSSIPNAVDGDYFAGVDTVIPANIPEYVTFASGSITDSIYTPIVPGGGAPSGAIVKIKHNVNVSENNINFYQTVIDSGATLTITKSDQHRFGKVTGKGTLRLVNTGTLPSGNFTDFLGCDGGKITFQGSAGNSYEILANMPPIEAVNIAGNNGNITLASSPINVCKNLMISGSGTPGLMVFASNSSTLSVGEDLIIDGGTFDLRQGNAVVHGDVIVTNTFYPGQVVANTGKLAAGNSGKLTIEGDLRLEGTTNTWINLGSDFRETHLKGNLIRSDQTLVQGGTDGAKLIFNGTFPQTITGDFTGTNKIPTIELNNETGLYLDGNVDVSEKLILTDGNIYTDPFNMLKLTADNVAIEPDGGHPNSFIDGPIQWSLNSSSQERKFPVGRNDRYRPLSVSNPSAARLWEVEYRDTLALENTAVTSLLPEPTSTPAIETVSKQEYWRVKTDAGTTQAKIRLSWGDSSAVSTNPGDQEKLVVMAYNTGTQFWDSYSQEDRHYDAATNRGDIKSGSPITFSERIITFGSTDALNPLPVTWLYFTGKNNGENNVLSWATASEQNNEYFELERSLDANNWISIAQIPAAGFSKETLHYEYTDRNTPFGRVYYRLKQVDFDGKSDFAPNVVSLEKGFVKEKDAYDFILYPNPTSSNTFRFRMSTHFDTKAWIWISDLSGKMLSQQYVEIDGTGNSSTINTQLEPGIYLITVIVDDKMKSRPLVISR